MISLQNVEKSVPAGQGRLWLLRQITLTIGAGEFVAVTGPSGAGKSTLLSILGLMDSDFAGRFELDGKPVHELTVKARQALQREAIGFIPFAFNLARREHAVAWRQLNAPGGFNAPWGLTTAEQRHPQFRKHGTGTCEWDGAVWPFATSQTLAGLANVLRGPPQAYVSRSAFLAQMETYARAHQRQGKPYLGEYHDEQTGEWLITGPKAERSRHYNHSTFNDLAITGLVGLVPRTDDVLEIDPLLPDGAWNWFRLADVPYQGRLATITWDNTGERFGKGAGLWIEIDRQELARTPRLERLTAKLPAR